MLGLLERFIVGKEVFEGAYDVQLRIAIYGPPKVGKSSFVSQLGGKPWLNTQSDNGDFRRFVVKIKDVRYELQFWEAGRYFCPDEARSITPYDGVILHNV